MRADLPDVGAGARANPGSGLGVRRVPDRPASCRGRPEPASTSDRSGPRSRRHGGRARHRRSRFRLGQRVGIAWLRGTCGVCRWCRRGRGEPLPGCTVHGLGCRRRIRRISGRARSLRVRAARPLRRRARSAAAVRRDHRLPRARCVPSLPPGGRLGIYGFGASAHLAAQVALAQGATVHVLTRAPAARELALSIGAHSAGPADASPPELLDAAILFAPAGDLVPVALGALDRGGTLADRRHPPERDPAARLRASPVHGTPGTQRHREHPRRR